MNATVWSTIAGLTVTTTVIRGSGPALFGSRELPAWLQRTIPLLAPALIAALIAVGTFTSGHSLVLDARSVGLVVAGVALLLRAPLLIAVLLAAVATALLRALI